jgi:hypothetical protein
MRIDKKSKTLGCNLICTSIQNSSAYITSNKIGMSRRGTITNFYSSRNLFSIHYEEIRLLKL